MSRPIKYLNSATATIAMLLLHAGLPAAAQLPEGAFLDIGRGEYWMCPPGYQRTVFPVTSDKACVKPAHTVYAKATRHGKGTGLLGTDCPKGQFWDPNGYCYSLPKGYSRTIYPVTGNKAGAKRIPESYARAKYVGQYLPDANLAALKAAHAKATAKYSGAEKLLSSAIKPYYGPPEYTKEKKRSQVWEELENTIRGNEDWKTATMIFEFEISALIGHAGGEGAAMQFAESDDEDPICRKIKCTTGFGGLTIGVDAGPEVGLWKGDIDSLAGHTFTVGVGGGAVVVSAAFNWHYTNTGPLQYEFAGITHSRGFGVGLTGQIGDSKTVVEAEPSDECFVEEE